MAGSPDFPHAYGKGYCPVNTVVASTASNSRGRMCYRQANRVAAAAIMLALVSMATLAQETQRADIEGTWLGKLITFDDPRWSLEDILCQGFCTVAAMEYIEDLLSDPANDDRSLPELQEELRRFNTESIASVLTAVAQEQRENFDQADDPVNSCQPPGFIIQAAAQPLPIKIEQFDDRVEFRYEYWDVVRTVYTDGRDYPEDMETTLYGHSIGWYDGPTLVIETRGFEPKLYAVIEIDGLSNTEQAIMIERYTKTGDGNQLDTMVTVVDPRMLRLPLVAKISYLSFPGLEFQEYDCAADSGEF